MSHLCRKTAHSQNKEDAALESPTKKTLYDFVLFFTIFLIVFI